MTPGSEHSDLLRRRILLGVYEEVIGQIVEIKNDGEFFTVVLKIQPRLLEVEFPRGSFSGEIPPPGTVIGILRTRSDYRIKIEAENPEKYRGVDSLTTIHAPQSGLSIPGEQASGKKRRGRN